jgi:hypothetical protein
MPKQIDLGARDRKKVRRNIAMLNSADGKPGVQGRELNSPRMTPSSLALCQGDESLLSERIIGL